MWLPSETIERNLSELATKFSTSRRITGTQHCYHASSGASKTAVVLMSACAWWKARCESRRSRERDERDCNGEEGAMTINVLLADDSSILRDGLAAL